VDAAGKGTPPRDHRIVDGSSYRERRRRRVGGRIMCHVRGPTVSKHRVTPNNASSAHPSAAEFVPTKARCEVSPSLWHGVTCSPISRPWIGAQIRDRGPSICRRSANCAPSSGLRIGDQVTRALLSQCKRPNLISCRLPLGNLPRHARRQGLRVLRTRASNWRSDDPVTACAAARCAGLGQSRPNNRSRICRTPSRKPITSQNF
jgi:hypothetical protein